MAERGHVIVVTVNYRLGVFGYFSNPQLGKDSGDYGLQDQIAALHWVHRNASAFGGNKHNITLFGESAGGFSTCALLTSPQMSDLFARAIIESGSCSDFFPQNTIAPGVPMDPLLAPLDQIQAQGADAATQLGCANVADVLGCLRRIPTAMLVNGDYMQEFSFPAYNTPLLPERPADALRAGKLAHVPIMVGNNHDEMRLYVATAMAAGATYDVARYHQLIADTFGAHAAAVESAYPSSNTDMTAAQAWAAAVTDDGWLCQTAGDEQALATQGRTVYGFVFADENAPTIPGKPDLPQFPGGAMHGAELSYLFWGAPGNAPQQRLSEQMIAYWTNFARSGDPNGPKLPRWKPAGGTVTAQQLRPNDVRAIDPTADHHCGLWSSVNASLRTP